MKVSDELILISGVHFKLMNHRNTTATNQSCGRQILANDRKPSVERRAYPYYVQRLISNINGDV